MRHGKTRSLLGLIVAGLIVCSLFRGSEPTGSPLRGADLSAATEPEESQDGAVPDFLRDVRPLLSDRCFPCHGPDAHHREADLRLDHQESAFEDRGGYHIIVPGDAAASELVRRIDSEDADERMPPEEGGKPLTEEERGLLRAWIESGASWEEHWAYVPPRYVPAPEVRRPESTSHWIDRFVLARLERENLTLSPPTDRTTLLRRLSFDLTGLPPTPEEVRAFLDDESPHAYERQVDRLLASPHFGERMAIYWLDLVRYADTVGYHGDQDHNISPYRDYVIDAFNENLPFDQFTREQLAGDLLPGAGPDQLIASGYNRLLQTSHEGGVQPGEYLAMYAADRVRNVSGVWMGATLGCAQCHDHKFDPLTSRDFYAMAAFFADVDEEQHLRSGTNALPTARPPELPLLTRQERARLAAVQREREALDRRLNGTVGEADRAAVQSRRDELAATEQRLREAARVSMITRSVTPRVTRILPRGNWLDESGPVVEPAVPEFLGSVDPALAAEDAEASAPLGPSRASRLDLAEWLTDPDDGSGLLTARVFANRLWYLCFGRGLSASLDDFGGQGQAPDHPELLDRLAIEFVDSGWDVKHLVRLMVTSEVYRQSSIADAELMDRDPYNRLLARQARFRLPAEMIRDQALASSGLLIREIGGASVKPYQPAGYYRHLNFPTREYQHDSDARQWRRGVYVHWQRQFLHPMLQAFDAPRREECTAWRPKSNTPTAALTLLNDPSFVEAARGLAARMLREGGNADTLRLVRGFQIVASRDPSSRELAVLQQFQRDERRAFAAEPGAAEKFLSIGQAEVPDEYSPIELAAWTSVARVLLNLNETLTRN